MPQPPLVPDGTRIGRTALLVADREEVADFYRDVVGLTVLRERPGTVTLGVDDAPLLVLEEDPDAPARPRDAAGLFHTAFRVPSRAALGDALSRIEERWTLTGASDHRVSEALYLRDPEGNGVEIYRDRPESEWPWREDGTVRIDTLPLDLEAVAAAASGAAGVPTGTTVGHVHLEVTALEAAREFYVETLGFGVQHEVDAALFVATPDYHHHLGLNAWNGRSRPASGRGLTWFEVVVPDEESASAVRDRLAAAGRSIEDREGGFAVAGPDGIAVRIRAE